MKQSNNSIFGLLRVIAYFSFCLIIMSSSCKRKDTRPYGPQYEEDPGPERGTVAERLQGSWRVEDYLRNDSSIYNQMSSIPSSTITLDKVYFSYTQASKDNGWHEKKVINPWPCYFEFNNEVFKFSSATLDSNFTYWFLNPELKINNSPRVDWSITKLYKNSFYLKLSTTKGNYKIKWKR